jgi:hypothetical protein
VESSVGKIGKIGGCGKQKLAVEKRLVYHHPVHSRLPAPNPLRVNGLEILYASSPPFHSLYYYY